MGLLIGFPSCSAASGLRKSWLVCTCSNLIAHNQTKFQLPFWWGSAKHSVLSTHQQCQVLCGHWTTTSGISLYEKKIQSRDAAHRYLWALGIGLDNKVQNLAVIKMRALLGFDALIHRPSLSPACSGALNVFALIQGTPIKTEYVLEIMFWLEAMQVECGWLK